MKMRSLLLLLPAAAMAAAPSYILWDDVPPIDLKADFYRNDTVPLMALGRLTITDNGSAPNTQVFAVNVDTFDKAVLLKDGSVELAGTVYAAAVRSGSALLAEGPTASLGYAPSSGGIAAQSGSLQAWVTLNRPCGVILSAWAALPAGATATFRLLDTAIADSDVVHATVKDYSGPGLPVVHVTATSSGSCNLTIQNIGPKPLNGRVSLNFAVLKSSAQ